MPVSKLTSKGQTTIPKEIRDALGLKPGDRIRFVLEDDNRVVLSVPKRTIEDLAGMFYDPNREPVSIEQMNEDMKQAVADHVMGVERAEDDDRN